MSDVKPPFFILGCVRSGTTLLRDVLRLHPGLICPEETHFFRWGDPFGTPRYDHPYIKNAPIRKQREMDGISDYEARICLKLSWDRKELANGYAHLYAQKIGRQGARWFDKTPQNVYGILLISSLFPDAKFIHIHRNPLNVVTSLLQGKVMPVHPLKGAINY